MKKTISFYGLMILGIIIWSFSISAYADTNVSGPFLDDTNWSTEGSPYIVTRDMLILNATLTVDAGVTIKFNGYYQIELSVRNKSFSVGFAA